MDVTVKYDASQVGYITGGGVRESQGQVYIDPSYPVRLQREAVIYETLGLLLDNVLSHEQLEHIAGVVNDSLDQWEGEHEQSTRGDTEHQR